MSHSTYWWYKRKIRLIMYGILRLKSLCHWSGERIRQNIKGSVSSLLWWLEGKICMGPLERGLLNDSRRFSSPGLSCLELVVNWLTWCSDWRCCNRNRIECASKLYFWLHLFSSSGECWIVLNSNNHTSRRLVSNFEVLCFHALKVLFDFLAERLVVSDFIKRVCFWFVFDVYFDIFIHLGWDSEWTVLRYLGRHLRFVFINDKIS